MQRPERSETTSQHHSTLDLSDSRSPILMGEEKISTAICNAAALDGAGDLRHDRPRTFQRGSMSELAIEARA